jgi:hypothetical protein
MSSLYGASPMKGPTGKVGNKIPSGYSLSQVQQYTPEQMELYGSLFGHLGPDSFLSQIAGGDEGAFAELEAPALKQFSGLQGNIASRFSGMGQGARGSSGFQNTMNQAGADFASQLQSQRLSLRQQALQDLMGYSNQLLNQRPYENQLTPKSNPWADIAGKFAGAIPNAAAGFLSGGPPGAVAGGASSFFGGAKPLGSNTSGAYNLPTFLGQ